MCSFVNCVELNYFIKTNWITFEGIAITYRINFISQIISMFFFF